MKNHAKGTVRFSFKSKQKAEKNKKEEFFIYLYFTYGSQRLCVGTAVKARYDEWDFKKQRLKNITRPYKDEDNDYLDKISSAIINVYKEGTRDAENISPLFLRNRLKSYLKNETREKSVQSKLTFTELIDKYITYKKGSIAPVTIRVYNQALNLIKEYESHFGRKLELEEINPTFHKNFTYFLEKKKTMSKNTIAKHFKSIKTFMNYALNEGYTKNTRFKSADFSVTREITTEVYLTQKEIQKLFNKDLSKFEDLEHTRDIFLIGCYTGQRVSDYNNLTKNDIVEKDGIRYFKIIQKKNRKHGRTVFCPITREIQEIMDKRHNGEPPKRIPEAVLNKNLKDLAKHMDFDEWIKVESTKGGKHEVSMERKYDLIKSHTARRSFCTNMYKAGMPVYDIMLFSGHTTEKEFYKYIRIKHEERASHIVKNGYFSL